jgi:hypothetical protein
MGKYDVHQRHVNHARILQVLLLLKLTSTFCQSRSIGSLRLSNYCSVWRMRDDDSKLFLSHRGYVRKM